MGHRKRELSFLLPDVENQVRIIDRCLSEPSRWHAAIGQKRFCSGPYGVEKRFDFCAYFLGFGHGGRLDIRNKQGSMVPALTASEKSYLIFLEIGFGTPRNATQRITMPENLIDRLRTRMKELGLNPGEVADQAGIGKSFVHDILLGRSLNPTTEKLGKVANVLGTSVEYLLNGTLPVSNSEVILRGETFSAVPFVNVVASMGGGAIVEEESEVNAWLFPRAWICEGLATFPSHLRLIKVSGDSMEPTLRNNDTIMIDTSKSNPSRGGLYVLDDGYGLVAKRLDKIIGSGQAMVRIISDNSQYPAYERMIDEIRIIGKIVWFARQID